MDIDQAVNDRYDIVPPIPIMALVVSMAALAFAGALTLLVWNIVKLFRSWRRVKLDTLTSSSGATCCEQWCLGRGNVFVVVIAFWVLMAVIVIACALALAIFYGLYPILRDSFVMFVAYTLPLAQPVLVLALVVPVYWGMQALRRVWLSSGMGVWERRAIVAMYAVPYAVLLLFLIAVPIYLTQVSPNITPPGFTLVPKPRFWAHRLGASWGPENTLCALNFTLQWYRQASFAERQQLFGVECDVRFSLDDVPFLLHDTTFLRTTNVQQVFPTTPAQGPMIPEQMNYSDIRQLNAGSWFPVRDPFGEIGSKYLSQAQAESYMQGCFVPTLGEVLRMLSPFPELHIMWNVRGRRPPNATAQLLEMIAETGMSNRTLWLMGDNEIEWGYVQSNITAYSPGVLLALGDDTLSNPVVLKDADTHGFEYVNSPLQLPAALFRANVPSNMTTIVYDLNEMWIFSQLWLQGTADLIASNVFQRYLGITQPQSWTMSSAGYIAMSAVIAAAALVAVVLCIWISIRSWRLETPKMSESVPLHT